MCDVAIRYPSYGVSSEYGAFDLAGYEKGGAWWYVLNVHYNDR